MSRLLTKGRRPQLVMMGHKYLDAQKKPWVVTGYNYDRRVVFVARDDSLCMCSAADLNMVWEAEEEQAKERVG